MMTLRQACLMNHRPRLNLRARCRVWLASLALGSPLPACQLDEHGRRLESWHRGRTWLLCPSLSVTSDLE